MDVSNNMNRREYGLPITAVLAPETTDLQPLSYSLTSALNELAQMTEQTRGTCGSYSGNSTCDLTPNASLSNNTKGQNDWLEDVLDGIGNTCSYSSPYATECSSRKENSRDSGLWSPTSSNSPCYSAHSTDGSQVFSPQSEIRLLPMNLNSAISNVTPILAYHSTQELPSPAAFNGSPTTVPVSHISCGVNYGMNDYPVQSYAMMSRNDSQSCQPGQILIPVTTHKAQNQAANCTMPIEAKIQGPKTVAGNDVKPSDSYIALIAKSILNHPRKRVLLADIYSYVITNYPYYKEKDSGWKNSLRHNLSVNDCFVKAGKAENGRGFYWAVHPACVEAFLQGDFRRREARRRAQKSDKKLKAPCGSSPSPKQPSFHPYTRNGFVQMTSTPTRGYYDNNDSGIFSQGQGSSPAFNHNGYTGPVYQGQWMVTQSPSSISYHQGVAQAHYPQFPAPQGNTGCGTYNYQTMYEDFQQYTL